MKRLSGRDTLRTRPGNDAASNDCARLRSAAACRRRQCACRPGAADRAGTGGRQHDQRQPRSDQRSEGLAFHRPCRARPEGHDDLRRRCVVLLGSGSKFVAQGQRRVRPGRQSHFGRARRNSTPRHVSAPSTTRPAFATVKPPKPDTCGRRRRAAADARPGHGRVFLRRDDRKARPAQIQNHQRRVLHLRAADAALGSERRHGRPQRRSLHAAASRPC